MLLFSYLHGRRRMQRDTDQRSPTSLGAPTTGPFGIVTIDVQNVFFTRATKRNAKNVEGRMANIEKVWKLAAARNIPVFITFEDSKSGDHALPPTLTAARPPSAQDFIKTTFAATGQPQFVPALMCCNVKRFLVLGAETDVCGAGTHPRNAPRGPRGSCGHRMSVHRRSEHRAGLSSLQATGVRPKLT